MGFQSQKLHLILVQTGITYFFRLSRKLMKRRRKDDGVKLNIWNYNDSVLQETQVFRITHPWWGPKEGCTAVINVSGSRIVELEKDDEIIVASPPNSGDFVVISDKYSVQEYWWKRLFSKVESYLVSLKDGSEDCLTLVL